MIRTLAFWLYLLSALWAIAVTVQTVRNWPAELAAINSKLDKGNKECHRLYSEPVRIQRCYNLYLIEYDNQYNGYFGTHAIIGLMPAVLSAFGLWIRRRMKAR